MRTSVFILLSCLVFLNPAISQISKGKPFKGKKELTREELMEIFSK